MKKSNIEIIADKASRARCDLYIFSAVIALMESSLVSSDCFGAEARIVTICKAENAKCLRRFDSAMEKLALASEGK